MMIPIAAKMAMMMKPMEAQLAFWVGPLRQRKRSLLHQLRCRFAPQSLQTVLVRRLFFRQRRHLIKRCPPQCLQTDASLGLSSPHLLQANCRPSDGVDDFPSLNPYPFLPREEILFRSGKPTPARNYPFQRSTLASYVPTNCNQTSKELPPATQRQW